MVSSAWRCCALRPFCVVGGAICCNGGPLRVWSVVAGLAAGCSCEDGAPPALFRRGSWLQWMCEEETWCWYDEVVNVDEFRSAVCWRMSNGDVVRGGFVFLVACVFWGAWTKICIDGWTVRRDLFSSPMIARTAAG